MTLDALNDCPCCGSDKLECYTKDLTNIAKNAGTMNMVACTECFCSAPSDIWNRRVVCSKISVVKRFPNGRCEDLRLVQEIADAIISSILKQKPNIPGWRGEGTLDASNTVIDIMEKYFQDHSPKQESVDRPYPCLLSDEENDTLIEKAKNLWHELEENMLGGFSDENRPIFIFHEFKEVIEKYGNRDVGLKWSRDELDKARKTNNKIKEQDSI